MMKQKVSKEQLEKSEKALKKRGELAFLDGLTYKEPELFSNTRRAVKMFESWASVFINDIDNLGKWCVYIVVCMDNTLYTGITNDIIKRLEAHNDGKGAKYTRGRLPVYIEAFHFVESKSEALKLEYKIKQMKRLDKIPYLKSLRDESKR
jgi:putative endonuclease